MIKGWGCRCTTCNQWYLDEYDADGHTCPACHGEWMLNYQEEASHEPPEEFYDSLGETKNE